MSNTAAWVTGVVVGAALGVGAMWWFDGGASNDPVAQAPVTPTPSVTITATAPTPEAPMGGEETPGTFVIPAALQGTWCTRSGKDPSGGQGKPCFSFAELLAQNPGMTLDRDEPPESDASFDPDAPEEPFSFTSCLDLDLGLVGCTMAETMFFEFYPVGVPWSCQTGADEFDLPGCDPDFTAAHDITQPRLVIRANHQQGDLFYDTEPMYQQQG